MKRYVVLSCLVICLVAAETRAQTSKVAITKVEVKRGSKIGTKAINVSGEIFIGKDDTWVSLVITVKDPKGNAVPGGTQLINPDPPRPGDPVGSAYAYKSGDITPQKPALLYSIEVVLTYKDKGGTQQQNKQTASIPVSP